MFDRRIASLLLFAAVSGVETPVRAAEFIVFEEPVAGTRVPVENPEARYPELTEALQSIPPCLGNPDGRPIVVVVRPDEELNAFYVLDHEEQQYELLLFAPILDDARLQALADSRASLYRCEQDRSAARSFATVLQDQRRVLIHELAHHWENVNHAHGSRAGRGINEGLVEAFLSIRYVGLRDRFLNSPTRQRILGEIEAIESQDTRTPADLQRRCDLYEQYDDWIRGLGVPSRFPGDWHALDDEISEYFAYAVEFATAPSAHTAFCSQFTPAERAWLSENLGGCLAQVAGSEGVAPCLRPPAADPGNAGSRGDIDGVDDVATLLQQLGAGPSDDVGQCP